MAILKYINGFYNPRRRYSALGCKSPVVFEKKVAETSTGGSTKARQVQIDKYGDGKSGGLFLKRQCACVNNRHASPFMESAIEGPGISVCKQIADFLGT
jgi:hypothetical protein